jgi:glycosyltransferase involved in cell wall biosynthesis
LKRLLVIAHQFPPAGGIGVQRVLRFCRDLPSHGWSPLVLTGTGADYPNQDPTPLRTVAAEIQVARADLPGPIKRFLPRLTPPASARKRSILQRLGFAFWIYDDFLAWVLPALIRGKRIIRSFSPDAVFATGSPFCSLVAGDLVAGGRIPLFVDFRDGWHRCPYRRDRGRLPDRVEGLLERRILRRCSAAFFVTHGLTDQYRARYPELASKFHWLPNGYEAPVKTPDRPLRDRDTLRVAYVGKFTPYRRPDAFLRGLRKAVQDFGCRGIEIEFVGGLDEEARGFIQREGLSDTVKTLPFLSHQEAIGRMSLADVLLLVVDGGPGYRVIQTGKIFEYMVSGRPILCISPPDSEAARTVAGERLGQVVSPEDDEAIASTLMQWVKEKRSTGSIRRERPDPPPAYHQPQITARLIRFLEDNPGDTVHEPSGTAAQYA